MARHVVRFFPNDSRGASLVEFALIAPLLMMILLGILGYGQYFLLAHSAQQIANDAARATVAGMSSAERQSLAQAALTRELPNLPEVASATLSVSESLPAVTVQVRVDASRIGLYRLNLLPMPDPTIVRSAVIQQGGVL